MQPSPFAGPGPLPAVRVRSSPEHATWVRDGSGHLAIDPARLPVTPGLGDDLERWAAAAHAARHDEEATITFLRRGHRLAELLRAQLGPGTTVTFFDHRLARDVPVTTPDPARVIADGDVTMLDALLRGRLDVNREVAGRPLLHHALTAAPEQVDLVALLLAAHADPDRPASADGRTARGLAHDSDHWQAALLIDNWRRRPVAEVPRGSRRVTGDLHDLLATQNLGRLRDSILAGADIHAELRGVTPLHAAVLLESATRPGIPPHLDRTALLLSLGADPHRRAAAGTGKSAADLAHDHHHWPATVLFTAW